MPKEKRSFFERLTGAIRVDNDAETDFMGISPEKKNGLVEDDPAEGQLTVDVFQTPTDIIIKTIVAGVRPEDLDISITRDMVTIKGKREGERNINDGDYFHKELYWGAFSRTVLLPQEIEVEESEAVEKYGLLIIRMPKLNKDKQTKLRVKPS